MNLLNILKNVFALFCSRSLFVIISSKEVLAFIQGWQHYGVAGGPWPPHFFVWQKKKNKKRISKQKLLKGCHQGKNVTALVILQSLEFKNFSCGSTMVASITFKCSMAPPLWNPFRRPCYKVFSSNDLMLSFCIVYLCFILDLRRGNSRHKYVFFKL